MACRFPNCHLVGMFVYSLNLKLNPLFDSMKNIYLLLFLAASFLPSRGLMAQFGVNYNDVAVVVNTNSAASQTIADYFVQKRNIPSANIIPVNCTTDEEVSDSLFRDYAGQIKSYLQTHNLQNDINYIVTTKGCPLKVLRSNPDCNASAESELMLMTPSFEDFYLGNCTSFNDIANNNFLTNPYFMAKDSFYQLAYQIFLVTRLDAYNVSKVLTMIDNSGPNVLVDKDSALFVLDQSPNWGTNPLNTAMARIADTLSLRGWNVLLNSDSNYVTGQNNVLGYVSWGSNDGFSRHDSTQSKPLNTWVRGAIAETHVSTSGRSLQPGTTYGQSLIADWIHEGVSGVKGYVYEPFTVAIANSSILFDRYTDLRSDGSPKFNLAQSYFSASRMIGWMDVVIGDPKTSITTNPGLANSLPVAGAPSFRLYPNPTQDVLYIESGKTSLDEINIYNCAGQLLMQQKMEASSVLNIRPLPAGIYLAELISKEGTLRVRWVKQ